MKLRIGEIDYDLELTTMLHDKNNGGRLLGHIDFTNAKISIDLTSNPQVKYQTLWHEIIHGLISANCIELNEVEVDLLAHGVAQVLRDNSKVLDNFNPWSGNVVSNTNKNKKGIK